MITKSEKVLCDKEKIKNFTCENEKKWPQILSVLAIALGSLSSGIFFVWSSPFALVITQDKQHYNITEEEASYFTVFHPVGMIFGSLFMFKITELLGRKKSVLLVALPQLFSWITIIFARNKWAFYFARFLGGIADCCVYSSIPPYLGEVTTPEVRGFWGNIPSFYFYGGQVFITVIGSYLDVPTTAYICMTIPVLFLLTVSCLRESPYQLIKDGNHDDARKSIKWLRRKADIEDDFQSMKADVERQISESGSWKDFFTILSNMRALRASVFLRFSQQLSGIAVLSAYCQPIFEKAGGNISSQYSSIIFMSLMWILNLFSGIAVDKFGRKPCYFYSLLSSGIVLLFMAIYFFLEQFEFVNLERLNWFPLAGMIAYVFTYSFGLGVLPTLMLGELFSASIKLKALCVNVAVYGLSFFFTSNLFHQLTLNVGLYSPFLVYGICCLVSSILTLRWVPETKGKTLEEIQQCLKK